MRCDVPQLVVGDFDGGITMQRRHEAQNIPIELLRSFVVIQECGSYTRAAEALHLTQPAISAQIKRLQQLVGGEVFVRSGFGVSLSEKGEIVSRYARRILAMNDQILGLSGAAAVSKSIRVGIPNVYAATMLQRLIAACREVAGDERIQFTSDSSVELARSLSSGYLDIAFLALPDVESAQRSERWSEPLCWVCAQDFGAGPGAPIPLQSWPHGVSDQLAIEALEHAGLSYSIVFTASDLGAHFAALRAGLGYLVLPQRLVPSDLKIARDFFLPGLPACDVGIYINSEKDTPKLRDIAGCLRNVFHPDIAGLADQADRPRDARQGHG